MLSGRTKLGLITLVILGGLVSASSLLTDQTYQDQSLKSTNPAFAHLKPQTNQNPALQSIVESSLKDQEGEFAVYIEKLGENQVLGVGSESENARPEGYDLNSFESYPAASLYKLVLMAAILDQVQKGHLSLETEVSATKDYLTDRLGSVDFGYEESEGTISYTVDQALVRVATISDNFAAILLTDELFKVAKQESNNQPLRNMALSLKMENTFFPKDGELITTTALDVARYFKLLYQGRVVSQEYSNKIIELLSRSRLNNRIPDQLPEGTKVAHKTGELAGVRHDAGIVFLDQNPYLIVLMSKQLKDENEGVELLSEVSKQVFDYHKNQIK